MNQIELAKKVFSMIEANSTAAVAPYLTEDFTFSGSVPKPVDAKTWLTLQDLLFTAFPDLKYDLTNLHQEGDEIRGSVQLSGTHTGKWDLAFMGMPVIPPTGKSFSLPKSDITIKLKGDKISFVMVEPVPGGGLQGILSQIGVAMPVP